MSRIRIGVDVGGTKIEALALDLDGLELARYRVPTPCDYRETITAIVHLVAQIESKLGSATVGVGIPGCIPASLGLVKNANTMWLNGLPFDRDLSCALEREVRVANDANCFAVSEATDGAAAGKEMVFGVILGSGCGGGIAVNGRIHAGMNSLGGEWGHIPLPWTKPGESPGPACYCGRHGCLEAWVSGRGLMREYQRATGIELTGPMIAEAASAGKKEAVDALASLAERLARGLALVIDILDPDVIVIGGGVSQNASIYPAVRAALPRLVFGGTADTPVLQAKHGDSSGVRGAAWLWPPMAG